MHLFLRTLFHLFLAARRSALSLWGHSSVKMRAWPTDIDIAGHINNGMYFSLMDLGRFDLMIRSGMWQKVRDRGWTPVMSAETISFRKSLKLWQRYTMESRVIGFDERAMYFEQCMVVDGEIYARAFMAMRLVGRGRPVTNQELFEVIGEPPADLVLPEWIHGWRSEVALPGARKPAPFGWTSKLPTAK
ncbi:acyl-CoA thioesterase [Psychromicrobium lacuslunae]|uniref:4-hydroxybenzoyl-CoA thioesterase n=1 Tax=Psychromicrobium lacuslunae TaxID=1618207 RepID=A0A0D4C086_9MICC|nr:acyl-CoA thioesterase [Psychromicrobium lacuslunae]AJT42072.1 4-hydroxybenzoyl-CoA thioesterase [Psychromicrobium lacuslunae]